MHQIFLFPSDELGLRLYFSKITLPSASWSENPGIEDKVLLRHRLGTFFTYNVCEVPAALLALDSWVTAVLALTSNCRTGLWWESSRVLVPSECLVQDRQVRGPPGLKHQLGWVFQTGFDPSCRVMQDLETSSPFWAYAKVPLLPFLPSCLFVLCPFPCWVAWGCIDRFDAPARCPSLLLPLWSEKCCWPIWKGKVSEPFHPSPSLVLC